MKNTDLWLRVTGNVRLRRAEERRLIEAARQQRFMSIQSRIDVIRYREEFGIYSGWGRGNPETRVFRVFAGRQRDRR